uniref:CCHC-type domain-containing protein n=1 Tax=Tanacetum cinerariifolium TaxID=118510 RepID=A0A6L2LUA4_TANCI|nr:hypothetical protein [Tanacetum cinerariifolium]
MASMAMMRAKRFCIAIGPRFEVGESSSAPTARPTRCFRADYGFVGTLDDEIRRDPERDVGYGITDIWDEMVEDMQGTPAMTDVPGLSQRMTDFVMTIRQNTDEIYGRLDDAQDDRLLMSGQLNSLRRDRYSHARTARLLEGEARLSHEDWAQSRDASNMACAKVMSLQNGTRKNNDVNTSHNNNHHHHYPYSHDSGTGVRRQAPPTRECTYQDFMKCQPLYFKGAEGVTELTQWFERMETVFCISKCTVENQIKFATCTLLESALMWWNSHVKTVGPDVAYAITWTNLKKKMTDKYCSRGEIKKLEVDMWNLKVNGTEVNNQNQQQNKRQNTGRDYTAGSGEKKPYEESKPLCSKCNYHHDRPCAPKCHKCNRVGHLARDCGSPTNANTANNQRGTRTGGNGNAPAKVYAVGHAGINPDLNVVTGAFLQNNRYASILFNTGADRSFVSTAFSSQIDITPTTLDHYYDVELPDERIIGLNTIIRGITLNFLNHPFNINLMPVELGSFDVIICMDWLAKYQVVIVCAEKMVCIPWGNETLIIHGDESNQGNEIHLNIISCTKTQNNKKEHEEHLKAILELLKKEELYVKFSKCEFWIPKKGVNFDRGDKEEAAFQLIKQKLCSALILDLPEGSGDLWSIVMLRIKDWVLEKVGSVAYKLELPQELIRVHNTFHVSNLKKCYVDKPLAVPLDGLHFDDKLHFVEEPVEIMDREVKRLKRSRIPIVKVRWNSRRGQDFTWNVTINSGRSIHTSSQRLHRCHVPCLKP